MPIPEKGEEEIKVRKVIHPLFPAILLPVEYFNLTLI